MNYLSERVEVITRDLKQLMFKNRIKIDGWQYAEGLFYTPEEADKNANFKEFDSFTMHWFGKDRSYWFRNKITIPEQLKNKNVYLHVRSHLEMGDDGRNPQFLCFINGKPIQGMDMNHQYISIKDFSNSDDELMIDVQAYSGDLHYEFKFVAELCEIDEVVKDCLFDIEAPRQAFNRLAPDSTEYIKLRKILNDAINLLDLRDFYSDNFYASIKETREFLKDNLYNRKDVDDKVIASVVGHSHIDAAWLWTVEQTKQKVARTFSTQLKLMDEYPEFKYLQSSVQFYSFIKERYPEIFEKIKAKVKTGQWIPEGGSWVEADMNLISGESLVRQLLYGIKFTNSELDYDPKIFWLPDTFGYNAQMPQVALSAGLKYFMTTKISWNQVNKIPFDSFMWKGIDGSEILTHMITTPGINQEVDKEFFTTYSGNLRADVLMGSWERYQQKDLNNNVLIAFGHGDGGGGPTRTMLENYDRLKNLIDGIPRAEMKSALTFFEELEENVKNNKDLPVWVGDLYLEYHRGTYTSIGRNKLWNRKSESEIMAAEQLSTLTDSKYPSDELRHAWELILLNQFHDILPGTSIKAVNDDAAKDYAEVFKVLDDIIKKSSSELFGKGDSITLYNSTSFARNELVNLGKSKAENYVDLSSENNETQISYEDELLLQVNNIPAKGYMSLQPSDESKKDKNVGNDFTWDPATLELKTPFYAISFDKDGSIKSLYDVEFDREVLQDNKKANQFVLHEDKPMRYDNWDIDHYYTEKYWVINNVSKFEVLERGPLRFRIRVSLEISNSTIVQDIIFYKYSRRIDFKTKVDWKERQHLLKVYFPVNVNTDEATYDIQFGNIKRKTHQNTSWEQARFESCAQKWIDVSEGGYGVSLLNNCKYGHSVKDNVIGLTLLTAGIEPDSETDRMEHEFTYALLPHDEGWQAGNTVEEAAFLNNELKIFKNTKFMDRTSQVQLDSKNVIIDTIKQAEDGEGLVIRVFENQNRLSKVKMTLNQEVKDITEVNILEVEQSKDWTDLSYDSNDKVVSFTIKPYEIKTFLIK